MQEAKIFFDQALIHEENYAVKSGKEAGRYFLGKNIQTVFAFNDMIAYGLYNQLKKEKVSMPSDISIVGYDYIFFRDYGTAA